MQENLSNREKEVLRYIVENFIKYALPVGSRAISKQTDLNLSSATIRNVMSDLEDFDLLETPHTSAGRMPTDKGYRFYVDSLMSKESLNKSEINFIKNQIEDSKTSVVDNEDLFLETSRILGKISHQLAVVTQPFLNSGIFEKLELINISSKKILVVLNIKSGYVRTVMMEVESEISRDTLDSLASFLNERLQGLTLKEIRETFDERITDYKYKEPELIQMFINSIDKLYFDEEKGRKIFVGGTGDIITQPEFDDPKNFKNIIDLTEDKNLVVHIFQKPGKSTDEVTISIGSENLEKRLKDYSVVCTTYNFGEIKGSIGIIGPKRMNYKKMVSLIEYTSKLISEK
ncbi:MAG: heat-inducible transcriptional repressor HrcA [Ignavibacteriae bacterium]|nr:heat-inducible transcriptional repressor HrcA [Ignavibacteriota bacterium]